MSEPISELPNNYLQEFTRFENLTNQSVNEFVSKNRNIEIIRKKIEEQPNTTKDLVTNHQELFVTSEEVDGKTWFFTNKYGDIIMALVNSDEAPDIFRPRFFRLSGSDHQFKAYPGCRSNEMEFLKGNEEDKNHHYVQSAKLDSRIIEILQKIPNGEDHDKGVLISDYVPIMADSVNNKLGRNLEDFCFSEEQVVFRNKNWELIQTALKLSLTEYEIINHSPDQIKIKDFCTVLETCCRFFYFDSKDILKEVDNISGINDSSTVTDVLLSEKFFIKRFGNKIKQMAENITEAFFTGQNKVNKMMDKYGFVPDFNQEPLKRYIKTDGYHKIKIEVFQNKSTEGDVLNWEMATDENGRTYIDNIYDPTVGIDSYGTPRKKTNMGILVYKTEDYEEQVVFVPKRYKKFLIGYTDISSLIEMSKPVIKYKERLQK